MFFKKIESGKQLGVEVRIWKDNKFFWYSYAIQKYREIYYVYECEISEDNMADETYEYETVKKYHSLTDVQNDFPQKYGLKFTDIHTLKGQYIFNVNFYV